MVCVTPAGLFYAVSLPHRGDAEFAASIPCVSNYAQDTPLLRSIYPALAALPPDELAARAQTGDERALNELLVKMLPLIRRAREHFASIEREDAVQIGLIATNRAITAWRPDSGHFVSLCKTAIRHAYITTIGTHLDPTAEPDESGRPTYRPRQDAFAHRNDTIDVATIDRPSHDSYPGSDSAVRAMIVRAAVAELTAKDRYLIECLHFGTQKSATLAAVAQDFGQAGPSSVQRSKARVEKILKAKLVDLTA